MSGENYVNTASVATTAAPVGPSDLTITVANYTGYPAAPYWAEIEKGTGSAEIVRVTNVAGSTLTITRGQGGTSATSHGAGVNVEHVVPASHFNEGETHNAATNAHGVTGNVVGTSGAQTVSDKNFRGAFRSDFTDALPVGITSSFESNANSAAARDGFVHKNTAGDAARSGFLLQQSGTDRFKVSNIGNVTITPSSGTALTANGPAAVTGNTTVGGTLGVTGLTTLSGGANVTGAVTATGTLSGGSLSVSGAIGGLSASVLGTVHADTGLDTDGTLTVDGASTLTGAVAAGAGLTVAQGIASWGGRVVISVASTAAVTSPVAGDVVYDRSDSMWKRYTGSAWVDMGPGDSNTSHLGLYTLGGTGATQALTGGAAVSLAIGTNVVRSTPTVTVGTSAAGSGSIANSCFTLNRSGEYRISYTVGWQAPTVDTVLSSFFAADGNAAGTNWYGHDRFNSGATSLDLGNNGTFTWYFSAGTKLCLHVLANKNATINNGNQRTQLSIKFCGA